MRVTRGLMLGVATGLATLLVPATPVAAACTDTASAGVNWNGCDRSFAQLNGANLSQANLAGADLSYAALFQTDLSLANLRRANFKDSFPVGANLSGADATAANFSHADLVAARLEGTVLRDADLRRADLDFAHLEGADLRGALLEGADFAGTTGGESALFLYPPTSADDLAVVLQGSSVTIDLLGNDDTAGANGDARLSSVIVTNPAHGSITSDGVYRPSSTWGGIDRFTYRPVATVDALNLPAGAPTTVAGPTATVTVRTIRRIAVGAPWAGTSGVEGEIVRLYVAVFNRLPDQSGFDFWVGRRRAGVALADVAAAFLDSGEFVGMSAGIDDATFVDVTYLSVLARPGDPSGRAFWISQLADGFGRARMVATFAQADEFKTLTRTS